MSLPTLADVELIARQAGEILRAAYSPRPGYGQQLEVSFKSDIDLVTEVDRRSETFIMEAINNRYPGHAIVTEESGNFGESDYLWFIDPLDGTVNFAHGVPVFCVSLGFAVRGQMQLGVVYDPTRDECFSAESGRGAYLNGEPIRVSQTSDLINALLVTGFPYSIHTNPDNNLNHYIDMTMKARAVRRLGSAALDLCYVAAGRFDGYWEISLNAWDLAAGSLIAEEAGGVLSNRFGDPQFMQPPYSLIAANPTLHPKMVAVINNGGG